MNGDDRISREVAFLASLVVQKVARVSVDRAEDAGLLLLEMTASSNASVSQARSTNVARGGLTVVRRVAHLLPPLTARVTFASSYLGMRAGLLALRAASRVLQTMRP